PGCRELLQNDLVIRKNLSTSLPVYLAALRSACHSGSRRCVAHCVVSAGLGHPGATTYDPMHLCLSPFAVLSVSWDVWAGCQGPAAGCRTPSHGLGISQ